jgi:hypothetical protein
MGWKLRDTGSIMRRLHWTFALTALLVAALLAPAGAAAVPRLEGTFKMTGTYVKSQGAFGDPVGKKIQRRWTFLPRCNTGACGKTLFKRTTGKPGETRSTDLFKVRPTFYKSRDTRTERDQNGCRLRFRDTITLRAVASRTIGGEDRVSRIRAKLVTLLDSPNCRGGGKSVITYRGSLQG